MKKIINLIEVIIIVCSGAMFLWAGNINNFNLFNRHNQYSVKNHFSLKYKNNDYTPINGASYQITRKNITGVKNSFFLKYYMTPAMYNYWLLASEPSFGETTLALSRRFTSSFFEGKGLSPLIEKDWNPVIEEYKTLIKQLDQQYKPSQEFNIIIEHDFVITNKWLEFSNIFSNKNTSNNLFWPSYYTKSAVNRTTYFRQNGAVLELFFTCINNQWGIYKYNTRIVPQTPWALPFSYFFRDPYYNATKDIWGTINPKILFSYSGEESKPTVKDCKILILNSFYKIFGVPLSFRPWIDTDPMDSSIILSSTKNIDISFEYINPNMLFIKPIGSVKLYVKYQKL